MNPERRAEELKLMAYPELVRQPDVHTEPARGVGGKADKTAVWLIPEGGSLFLNGQAWMEETANWEDAYFIGVF